jgi:hypothetical protein
LPSGGNFGGPGGGGVGSGSRPSQLPAGGSGIANGGRGNIGAGDLGRPGTGPVGPARPGAGVAGGGVAGRTGIRSGPNDGGLSSANRGIIAGSQHGTLNVSRNDLVRQGNGIRNNFGHYDCFRPNWWGRYPGCWRAAAWTTAAVVWALPTWNDCYAYCGYPAEPVYYDYGTNVVYQQDIVYQDGEAVGGAEGYAQQAEQIADTGRAAKVSEDGDWMSLGVFAMAQEGGTVSNNLFQFAVNKDGVLRGNYYNGLNDSTVPIYGSVDKKTQRAAWTVGDKKNVTYEAGFANLTKNETTMLVHFGKDKTQQWMLVRMEQPKEGQ